MLKFDKWLAEEAEKKGALLVSNVQVTELITEGEGKHRRVIGVRCHDDEVYAKLVVIAEGSNTLYWNRLVLQVLRIQEQWL